MATQEQFQAKIDQINSNTTASALRHSRSATNLANLKTHWTKSLLPRVPAATEDAILAQLDTASQSSAALNTFLQQTAAEG